MDTQVDRHSVKEWPFDRPEYLKLTRARLAALAAFLDELKARWKIETALDVGCGIGHFTRYLRDQGLDVLGVDGREENILEARRRHPDLVFASCDVESPAMASFGKVDLVLCVGLIYHLENPFQAIRYLAGLARLCMYVEAMIIDDPRPVALLCDEGRTESQGLRYVAFMPSENCMVKMLYEAGFGHVYRPVVPDDETYRASILHVRQRAVFVASHEALELPALAPLQWRRHPKPGRNRFPRISRIGHAAGRVTTRVLSAMMSRTTGSGRRQPRPDGGPP